MTLNYDDPWLNLAADEVGSRYGDLVSTIHKKKSLLKFGRYANLGTSYETVQEQGGDETYVTTNAIDYVSSTDAGDTATVMYVEGHTVSGTGADSQFTFKSQLVTLNGQAKVALTTPLARVSRAYVYSGTLDGDFYVFEDDTLTGGVPDTATKIHLVVEGAASGHTQSFKASTTFSNEDYAFITGAYCAVTKKTTAVVDFVMEVRTPGDVFRPAGGRVTLNSAGKSSIHIAFKPYLIVPKNSDIRVRAVASTASVEVDASFQAVLASIVG